jgi:hypothetical protein
LVSWLEFGIRWSVGSWLRRSSWRLKTTCSSLLLQQIFKISRRVLKRLNPDPP